MDKLTDNDLKTIDNDTFSLNKFLQNKDHLSVPDINRIIDEHKDIDESLYTDLYRCPKCLEKKSTFWEVQMKAADEASTIKAQCFHCKKVWQPFE